MKQLEACTLTFIIDLQSMDYTNYKVAEWLRRRTQDPLKFSCVSSNPGDGQLLSFAYVSNCYKVQTHVVVLFTIVGVSDISGQCEREIKFSALSFQ